MLIVLGVLMGVCGVGCTGIGAAAPWDQVVAQAQQMQPGMQPMDPEKTRTQMVWTGVVSLVAGIVSIVMGIFVRKQNMVATTVGIVLVGLFVLYLLGNIVGTLFLGGVLGPGMILLGECVLVLTAVVAVWLLVWLIQAARSASAIRVSQSQMQMQYWQMMQMQQQQYQQQMAAQQQGQAAPPQGQGTGDMGQGKAEEKQGGGEAGTPQPPPQG